MSTIDLSTLGLVFLLGALVAFPLGCFYSDYKNNRFY